MGYVVSFKNFRPSSRDDGNPWTQAKIEESAGSTGPWTQIDLISLSPVDTDPKHPAARSFTTEDATLAEGWYRITWLDGTGDFVEPTVPIHNVQPETAPYLPTLEDVGAQLMSRTKDNLGNYLGTFTDKTHPTDEQVLVLIDLAADEITAGLDTDIPEGAWNNVRSAIAILTAMKVELSYYSDQVNTNRSIYPQLEESLKYLLPKVEKAVIREEEEARAGEFGLAVVPSYSFPASEGWDSRRM